MTIYRVDSREVVTYTHFVKANSEEEAELFVRAWEGPMEEANADADNFEVTACFEVEEEEVWGKIFESRVSNG